MDLLLSVSWIHWCLQYSAAVNTGHIDNSTVAPFYLCHSRMIIFHKFSAHHWAGYQTSFHQLQSWVFTCYIWLCSNPRLSKYSKFNSAFNLFTRAKDWLIQQPTPWFDFRLWNSIFDWTFSATNSSNHLPFYDNDTIAQESVLKWTVHTQKSNIIRCLSRKKTEAMKDSTVYLKLHCWISKEARMTKRAMLLTPRIPLFKKCLQQPDQGGFAQPLSCLMWS